MTSVILISTPVLSNPVSPNESVWVATGNQQYHTEYCRLIKVGFNIKKVPIHLAIKSGYTPHKKCNPPKEVSTKLEPAKQPTTKFKRIGEPAKNRELYMDMSAKDIPRDPDGTAIGNGGGVSIVSTPNRPHQRSGLSKEEAREQVKVLNITSKKIKRDVLGNTWYSVKLLARNLSNHEKDVYIYIAALDSSGYELATELITGRLAPNAVDSLTTKTYIDNKTYKKIKNWKVK